MKFTRLRLIGFKTFVEPTDVPIEPGLTGVVGPNGCGKSNLVEALRWVMGEIVPQGDARQRHGRRHLLRHQLAAGAQRRRGDAVGRQFRPHRARRLQRARDHRGVAPHRARRRLGLPHQRPRGARPRRARCCSPTPPPARARRRWCARARSARSSAPSPRRAARILEEAAGVAGLHARRHEAEIRLKAAETNLLRLDDVIGQIGGQIDALKRQARQSVRYRVAVGRDPQGRGGPAASALERGAPSCSPRPRRRCARRERAVAERTRLQAEAARDQAIAAHALPPLRDAEAKAGAALARLSAARDALEREEQRAGQRQGELDRQLAQLAHDIAREKTLATDAHARAGAARRRGGRGRRRARPRRRRPPPPPARGSRPPRARWPTSETALRRGHRGGRRPRRAARPGPARGEGAPRAAEPPRQPDRRRRGRPRPAGGRRRRRRSGGAPRGDAGGPGRPRLCRGAGHRGRGRARGGPRGDRGRQEAAARRRDQGAAARRRGAHADQAAWRPPPAICGRRCSTSSPWPRATRPRLAPRSATTSKSPPSPAPRCIGAAPRSTPPTRRCPRAPSRSAASCRAAGAGPAAGADRRGRPRRRPAPCATSSSPASGWCRWKAICGAGTASPPPPMRPPPPPGGWPSGTGSATSPRRWTRRGARPPA